MSDRPRTPRELYQRVLGDVGVVFWASALIIVAFVTAAALRPDAVEAWAVRVLSLTATNVGWMYLIVTSGFVLFIFFLGVSRFGNLRLGAPGEKPEFSFQSWLASDDLLGRDGRWARVLGDRRTDDALRRAAARYR